MSNPNDPRFKEVKAPFTREEMNKMSGIKNEDIIPVNVQTATVVEGVTTPAAKSIQGTDADKNLELRIQEMEQELAKLKKGYDGGKVTTATKKVIDYSKLSEKDVFDLSIPLQAIPQGYLDPTQIKLKDPAYAPRFVSKSIRMMGQRKQLGFTFVTKEDIDFEACPMGLDLQPDENGQFCYIDTVLMKIPKDKYYAALRANYLRALAVTDRKRAIENGKTMTENEIASDHHREWQDAREKNQMEVYVT